MEISPFEINVPAGMDFVVLRDKNRMRKRRHKMGYNVPGVRPGDGLYLMKVFIHP